MLLDHITMTSVDLTSRTTVYKPTPCNKTTVNLPLFISNIFYGWVGQCLGLTDTLRLAFGNLCAKLVVQHTTTTAVTVL